MLGKKTEAWKLPEYDAEIGTSGIYTKEDGHPN